MLQITMLYVACQSRQLQGVWGCVVNLCHSRTYLKKRIIEKEKKAVHLSKRSRSTACVPKLHKKHFNEKATLCPRVILVLRLSVAMYEVGTCQFWYLDAFTKKRGVPLLAVDRYDKLLL